MDRRLQLGINIADFASVPLANFVNNGDGIVIHIPIKSLPVPAPVAGDPQANSHRDILEKLNTLYGGDASVILTNDDNNEYSSLSISFTVNSKAPGSGG